MATEERHSLMQKESRARSTEVLQLTEACGQLAVDIEQTEGQLARAQAQLEEEESYVELLLSRPLATAATSETFASVASPSPSPDKKIIKLLVRAYLQSEPSAALFCVTLIPKVGLCVD